MKKVLLRGPFLTNSGYGVHARQVARWALSKPGWSVKVQALPWGITPWILDRNDESGLIGSIMDRTGISQGEQFDLSIQVQLPGEWDPSLAKKNIGVTAAVETDVCNPTWIESCNRMTAVVVPSSHTRSTLERTAGSSLRSPIIVIPEAYHDELAVDESSLELNLSTSFNFLIFGQLTGNNPENDRKNLFYTLKWIFEEFKDEKDVGIILKTNSGKTTKIDRLVTERFCRQIIHEARPGPYPKVHLLHGKMCNTEVAGLMRHPSVKALVALTRGEGYGLPILEAAACGLPVIATGWSGHTDFLGDDFISVEYSLDPIHKTRVDGKIFIEGSKWANPSEQDAKKKLRKFYQKSTMPRHKATTLMGRIRRDLSFTAVSSLYDSRLGALVD
jgi:hypothetical protein